jgi:ABC-type polysaccharide/polyol phosphate transport system ATPase subunit
VSRRIHLEEVTQAFRLIRERPDSLREAFTRILRRHEREQDFEALKHVSLSIFDGEVVGLIGRNGSGKSTLLKLIAGVYEPTEGLVEVSGKVAALIELGAGFHKDLTGRENIVLNGLLLGLSRKEIMRLEESIIDFAELGDFIDSPVKQYSSGMYMRLAFSIAIQVDPDILLVDEILSVGDAEFRAKCTQRISEFREAGKTIVMVTHDMSAIRKMCNRAVLLDRGTVLDDGLSSHVLSRYEELIHQPV